MNVGDTVLTPHGWDGEVKFVADKYVIVQVPEEFTVRRVRPQGGITGPRFELFSPQDLTLVVTAQAGGGGTSAG